MAANVGSASRKRALTTFSAPPSPYPAAVTRPAAGMQRRVRRLAPLLLLALAACGDAPREAATPARAPAFAVQRERADSAPRGRWDTAWVLRATALRAAPGGRRVGRLRRRT